MKTIITFDTARLTDDEQRRRLEESPGFELAAILRQLAVECEQGGKLPTSRMVALDESASGTRFPTHIGTVETPPQAEADGQPRMTIGQAIELVQTTSDLLTLGNRIERIEKEMGHAKVPARERLPLAKASGHIGATLHAVFRALENAHEGMGGPFREV
ncbi:hypothetical protein [Salinicola corii]|uniref:hypothetical protein n=1 Tax=Salinicola corii TaxID=2606937 RepID=UPI0016593C2F|nr:hypothetical protein [Salinicola corii]